MTPTWLYTIRSGQSVRVPWQDVVQTHYGADINWSHAEPYYEPPLRAQMPTREQQRREHMVGERMTSMDNRNAGLTRRGAARKDKTK
jgi:hypothetical protein